MFNNHNFTKGGYNFKLVKSLGDVYMFERIGVKEDWMTDELLPHWEVVRVVQRKASPQSDDLVWTYPSASDWGKLGFTLGSLEKANDKFNELSKNF